MIQEIISSNTDSSSSSNAIIDKDKETLSLQLKNAELSLSDWIDRYNRRGDENDRLRQDIKVQGLSHHYYCYCYCSSRYSTSSNVREGRMCIDSRRIRLRIVTVL